MSLTTRWIVPLFLVLSLTAPALAKEAGAIRSRSYKLPNGLTLILTPDLHAGGVDVTVWYPAGTRWESAGKTGITHVVEQLMFRTRPSAGEMDYLQRIQGLGGTAGAESTPDYSSFYETVPPEALGTVLEMEAGRMASLHVDAATFENVRALVRADRRRAENTPIVRGMQQLFVESFGNHPYAWPAIGRAEDLGAITLGDCVAWHRDRYAPNETIVTITGRFDPKDALAAARRTLGRVKKRDVPREKTPAPGPAPEGRRATAEYDFPGASVLLGWRVRGAAGPDRAALDVLANYVAGEADSPLNQALIGKGHPTAFVRAGLEERRDAGLFYVVAALQAGSDTSAVRGVESKIVAEVEKVAREGMPGPALERVRRGMRVARLFALQRPRELAAAIGRGRMLEADADGWDAGDRKLLAVTSDDVQKAAARSLAADARVTVWMLPSPHAQKGARP